MLNVDYAIEACLIGLMLFIACAYVCATLYMIARKLKKNDRLSYLQREMSIARENQDHELEMECAEGIDRLKNK